MKKLTVGASLLLVLTTAIAILTTGNILQTAANSTIPAAIQISPSRFGHTRPSEFFTFYIELPSPYNIEDIDASSIVLNGIVEYDINLPPSIGDENNNGIPDLAVKFRKDPVLANTDIGGYEWFFFGRPFFKALLTLSGELAGGSDFQGSCTMQVIWPRIRPL